MDRSLFHLLLHFALPGVIARLLFSEWWLRAWLIMVATMVVDADHFLASPMYDPNRCSIGFHPLHSYVAIGIYVVMTAFRPTRVVGLGLVVHMALDAVDCAWMVLGPTRGLG